MKWSQQYTAKVSIVVMGFFKWLSAENLLPFNPYIVNRFKRPRPKEPDYFTQKEFDFIVKNPQLTHQDQTLLRLAWDTGARRCELLSLNQPDIDFQEDVISIRHSKGGYGNRVVPFTKETHKYLEQQISELKFNGITEYIFIDHDWNRLGESACDKRIREIGNLTTPKHGALRLHLHALRHSLAMRLLDKGANESYVSRLLGHANLNMTAHYIHYSKGRSRELYDQLVGS